MRLKDQDRWDKIEALHESHLSVYGGDDGIEDFYSYYKNLYEEVIEEQHKTAE